MIRDIKNIWFVLATFFILCIILSCIAIVYPFFEPTNEIWAHIKDFLLKDYIKTTIIIGICVAISTVFIGSSTAYIITLYDFPLRNFFKWAFILPLAIPPYIAAYTYAGMLSFTGSIQVFMRNVLGIQESNWAIFDVMSIYGAIFIFTFFLFPYVYIIVYSYLKKDAANLVESAILLGKSRFNIYFSVILPVCRNALIGAVTLVLMEVLSDYGAVSYFGVQTLSTAIFTSWFNFSDQISALRIAGILLVFIFIILMLEKVLRGRKKFSLSNAKIRPINRKEAKEKTKYVLLFYCFLILSFAFFIPCIQLLYWAYHSYSHVLSNDFLTLSYNTLFLAFISSLCIIFVGLIIGNYTRIYKNIISLFYSKITIIGYAIPGTVLAITTLLLFNTFDRQFVWFYRIFDENTKTLLLSSSIFMLIFAYIIRYLGVGFQSIDAEFEKNGMRFYEASKMLGKNTMKTFFLVDVPMLKSAMIAGFSLTFVDIVKELPLALFLRPFNFETLGTIVYKYAHDEQITRGAIPSLFIITISLIAIYFINKSLNKNE